MKKITKMICGNNKELLTKRVETLVSMLELNHSALVNDLKQTKTRLEMELEKLKDLGPTSTTSLTVETKDVDPQHWVKKVQGIKEDLYFTNIKLKLAEETTDEFFTENE